MHAHHEVEGLPPPQRSGHILSTLHLSCLQRYSRPVLAPVWLSRRWKSAPHSSRAQCRLKGWHSRSDTSPARAGAGGCTLLNCCVAPTCAAALVPCTRACWPLFPIQPCFSHPPWLSLTGTAVPYTLHLHVLPKQQRVQRGGGAVRVGLPQPGPTLPHLHASEGIGAAVALREWRSGAGGGGPGELGFGCRRIHLLFW